MLNIIFNKRNKRLFKKYLSIIFNGGEIKIEESILLYPDHLAIIIFRFCSTDKRTSSSTGRLYLLYGRWSQDQALWLLGPALERGWNIEKVENGIKKIEFTSSEMGNFVYNYFLIGGNKLIFAFDRDSQKDFMKACALRFHRMVIKRNPKVKYTVDNYLRSAGVYKFQAPYVIKFCSNYYLENPKKHEYIYLITIETFNIRTGKTVKDRFLAGKTTDTGIDFVKNEITKGE